MTFETKRVDNEFLYNYCDEILAIVNKKISKKILKNPLLKIIGITKLYYKLAIPPHLVLLFFLILNIFFKRYDLLGGLVIFYIIHSILWVLMIYVWKRSIKILFKSLEAVKSSSMTIDNEKVEKEIFYSNGEKNVISINWDSIRFVIIYKYSICFVKNDSSTPASSFFCISVMNKDKIIKTLKKYNKESYLVDNTGLYNKPKAKNLKELINNYKTDTEIWFKRI